MTLSELSVAVPAVQVLGLAPSVRVAKTASSSPNADGAVRAGVGATTLVPVTYCRVAPTRSTTSLRTMLDPALPRRSARGVA
jgi:hypothetical protein